MALLGSATDGIGAVPVVGVLHVTHLGGAGRVANVDHCQVGGARRVGADASVGVRADPGDRQGGLALEVHVGGVDQVADPNVRI